MNSDVLQTGQYLSLSSIPGHLAGDVINLASRLHERVFRCVQFTNALGIVLGRLRFLRGLVMLERRVLFRTCRGSVPCRFDGFHFFGGVGCFRVHVNGLS